METEPPDGGAPPVVCVSSRHAPPREPPTLLTTASEQAGSLVPSTRAWLPLWRVPGAVRPTARGLASSAGDNREGREDQREHAVVHFRVVTAYAAALFVLGAWNLRRRIPRDH